MAEIEANQHVEDTRTSLFNMIDSIVTFVGEHPEIIAAAALVGKKAKNGIVNVKNKLEYCIIDI